MANKDSVIINNIAAVLLLVVISLGIFQYTVSIRKPWFGILSGHHQSMAGDTVLYSKNWYREGPLKLRLGMMRNPASVEFPALADREMYVQYPPGMIVPIYLISKLRGHEPTVSLVMKYNLLNHIFISIFLAMAVLFFLLQLRFGYLHAFVLSLIPMSLELLLPAPLYWHQNPLGYTQAIMLPVAIFIFFEVFRDSIRSKKAVKITDVLQGIVLWWGIFTNWVFASVALTVYIKRVCNKEIAGSRSNFIKKSLAYWTPMGMVVSLFIYQTFFTGATGKSVINSFLIRIGAAEGGDSAKYIHSFYEHFWQDHFVEAFGRTGLWLMFSGLAVFVLVILWNVVRYFQGKQVSANSKKILFLIGIISMPGLFYVYFFRNWSVVHCFSALIFSTSMVTVPFVLTPVLLQSVLMPELQWSFTAGRKIGWISALLVLCMVVSAAAYVRKEHPRFKRLFPSPNELYEKIGDFVDENTGYNDIVFTSTYDPALDHTQLVCYSMKRLHKINSFSDIYEFVKDIDGDYIINIFSMGYDIPLYENGYGEIDQGYAEFHEGIKEMELPAYDVREEGGLYLYKIAKETYLKMVGREGHVAKR